ncbi:MAG: cupin domain-containing protein [Segetibacter sp.]
MTAEFFINHLNLQPHPEGGYFKETYHAAESIPADVLPTRFNGDRSFSTAIYYLLQHGDYSAFHRIKSDECWHFYAGQTLLIHIIKNDGKYYCIKLGANIDAGEIFQFAVPATAWFAAEPAGNSAFVLAGCTVAPGFDFADFEIADQQTLLSAFPQHSSIISRLCRQD